MGNAKEIHLPAEEYRRVVREDGKVVHYCTERQIVMHCIGLDYRKPYHRHGKAFYRPYRNCFATSTEDKLWAELAEAGYAAHDEPNQDGGVVYWLTREGLDWLGKELGIQIHNVRG